MIFIGFIVSVNIFLEGRATNDTIVNHLITCGAFRFHRFQRKVRGFRSLRVSGCPCHSLSSLKQ
eukprot:692091-Hanusia_phi.AAC.1